MDENAGSVPWKGTVQLTIRSYRPEDREAIRQICLETAFRNKGYRLFFEDGEIFADYWTNYYLDYQPDTCYVAEKNGIVVGYLLGCPDSSRFMRIMKKKIVPRLALKLLRRMLTLRYRKAKTYRYIRWLALKSWREVPPIPVERYACHYHLNLTNEGRHQNGPSRLLHRFLDEMEARNVEGLYAVVLEPKSGGFFSRSARKIESTGYQKEYYAERPTDLFKDVLKDPTPMVNRVYASSIPLFRIYVRFLTEHYNL